MPDIVLPPVADGSVMEWGEFPLTMQPFETLLEADDNTAYLKATIGGQNEEFLVRTAGSPTLLQPVRAIGFVTARARLRRIAPSQVNPVSFRAQIVSAGQQWLGPQVDLPLGSSAWLDYDGVVLPGWQAQLDPATGAAWTFDAALAAEIGFVDVTGVGLGPAHELRCTWLRKVVRAHNAIGPNAARGGKRR